MMPPPHYFEPIRQAAAKRWNQLEADPDLAGPWHQLFKQVQSPRHVLSELLQNADDAGATETSVRIEHGVFIFTHNGEDFVEEHFASLCRFGYSNKRALHTIGFRGIGFKSLFSLGDSIKLFTPTLSVAFEQHRFTEPRWVADWLPVGAETVIRVPLRDDRRELEIQKNLDDWIISPLSLLFFRHIRKIKIGDRVAIWESFGPGPVAGSEWMALNGNADDEFLVVRSGSEAFPEEALAEIREERLLSVDQSADFPPCSIDIVLGARGRLYVVLPTGVDTVLPFACNAPFIQDPARLKIKDPEISFTNRWLLERAGRLATLVMLRWLRQKESSLAERSRAYCMLPVVDRSGSSLEAVCARIVESAFEEPLSGAPFLLTSDGDLMLAKESVIVPDQLLDVWSGDQAAALLDERNRPALSRHVSEKDREKLIHWGVVDRISAHDLLTILQSKHLPKPGSWSQLLTLWDFIAPEITGYRRLVDPASLSIVPVQGKDMLYSAREVTRLGEKRLLASEDDWEFLPTHLLVLNQNWPRYLAEQRRSSEDQSMAEAGEKVASALAVLTAIGLSDTGDVSKVIEQVAVDFFAERPSLSDCIRLAQIAAKLGATPARSFRFATQDRFLRSTDDFVLHDQDGTLAELLPEDWCSTHLLHPDYWASFRSCTSSEWLNWLSSGRGGLLGFVPMVPRSTSVWSRRKVESEIRKRSLSGLFSFPYVSNTFLIEDWDFGENFWTHWAPLAEREQSLWGRICERILEQPSGYWSQAEAAHIDQIATNGNRRAIYSDTLMPSWILRLRELPCLRDTRGFYRTPSELLLRTPETEALLDVEPFVHLRLDSEKTRPLLSLLGVRKTPVSAESLLDRLRALAKAEGPPVHEVDKLYRRLDQMLDACSTVGLANIKNAFSNEKIILDGRGDWNAASSIFLSFDEEGLPDAALIRASVQDLALWRKLGVADRPTAELVIQWVQQLPSGAVLAPSDARRIRTILPIHAVRIWNECGHWLNLASEWVPAMPLRYALTMQSLVGYSHLYEWVKQETADLQRLPLEVSQAPPFSHLSTLAASIEERLHQDPLVTGYPSKSAWLSQLGEEIQRIQLADEAETAYTRKCGEELAATMWQRANVVYVVPYIGGVPAGTPRRARAIWLDKILYTEDCPMPTLAPAVCHELERTFRRQDIATAIKFCFDRAPEFVADYMEATFTLSPKQTEQLLGDDPVSSTTARKALNGDTPEWSPFASSSTSPLGVPASQEIQLTSANNDGGEDNLDEADDADRRERHGKPGGMPIMERFARIYGFRKDNSSRFSHADGSWIEKTPASRFWERWNAKGELVRYYHPKDHCMQCEPLTMDADIWIMIEKFPGTHSLILCDVEGLPVEWTGDRLRAMRDGGNIRLYPATYRLTYEDGYRSPEALELLHKP